MATPVVIPSVIGTQTRNLLAKWAPILKQAVAGAKASDVIETGVVVDGEWKMTPLATAAEINAALREMRVQ